MEKVTRRAAIAGALGQTIAVIFGWSKATKAANTADGDLLLTHGMLNEQRRLLCLEESCRLKKGCGPSVQGTLLTTP